MARRSQHNDEPEPLRKELVELLTNFAAELQREDFREKVIALVPAYHKLRDLGSSLMPGNAEKPALERILSYLFISMAPCC